MFRELFDALHRKGRTDVTVSHRRQAPAVAGANSWPARTISQSQNWVGRRVVCAFQVRFGERVATW